MTDYVLERERKLPVISHYDIVVVGAGIAGTAAALAASRHNKKVLLVERMYAIGGLATLGLITVYLPLCDGTGRQICFGLNDEFLKLAISRGYEGFPVRRMNTAGSVLKSAIMRRFLQFYWNRNY